MNDATRRGPRGMIAAVATPLTEDLTPNHAALIAHCRWLLANGCDGLTLLGTTGGFASLSVAQRLGVMTAVRAAGLPLERVLVGTGASALEDAATLTSAAVALGFAGALVIPPFYYKNVTEDGAFAFFAHLIERAGPDLRLYLYHFPQLSGVPFTTSLIARLRTAFPLAITGLKDSSGDPANTATLRQEYPDLALFPGSEARLSQARRAGYAGCISATLNVTSRLASRIWNLPEAAVLAALERELDAMREAIASVPLIPAVHALLGELHADPGWLRLLPPLSALSEAELASLAQRLAAAERRVESVLRA